MKETRPEQYKVHIESVPPFRIRITSYKVGDVYYCTVDNIDPGAVIARSRGKSQEEAESKAIAHARQRVEATVVRRVT